MTCAKARVIATLTLPSGETFTGENLCANPQWVCPREEGDGYEKCRTICGQTGHAEVMAMAAAGWNVRGGHMRVAYSHVCQDCRDEMAELGVTWEICDEPSV